jgi:broad specificity phosphatase PhoE
MAKTRTKTRKSTKTFKLYLVRHGISCANLARAYSTAAANRYTDPELTREGRRRATLLKPLLLKAIQKPFVAGASILLRTQQTAQLLLDPPTLHIVPHISEFGRHIQESTALPPAIQASLLDVTDPTLSAKRDYTYMEPPVPEHQQLDAFLQWLHKNIKEITSNGKKSLVLVSHYMFIQALLKRLIGIKVDDIANCELVAFDVVLKDGQAILENTQGIDYMPKRLRHWTMKQVNKGHGCRLSVSG